MTDTNRRLFLQAAVALPLGAVPAMASDRAASGNGDRLQRDPLRPCYHFHPRANWMNDPNGPIFWKGCYHLFYQYNPEAPVWGAPHWGHAVSSDMVHWSHRPVALAPTPGGPDQDGVFSGTAVVTDGRVSMMYTAVHRAPLDKATIKDAKPWPLRETQCLATARDDSLDVWDKRQSPVLASPPEGMLVNGFRDPSPWRYRGGWLAVLGSGRPGLGGAILLYRSDDLLNWEFVKLFAERAEDAALDPWEVWECPEFFPLGDRHVLIFSTARKAFWQSGHFDEQSLTFHPERSGILDYGDFYAPKTQLDADGNRILWGWVPETRSDAENRAAGWAGAMSLPRRLTMDSDGRLIQSYLPALSTLRSRQRVFGPVLPERLSLASGAAEIQIDVREARADFGIEIADRDGSPAIISIAWFKDRPELLWIDGRPLAVVPGAGDWAIRVFIDGSIVELSLDGRAMWTRRFYYQGPQRAPAIRTHGAAGNHMTMRTWDISTAVA
ncbi:glycoside hydrolase family 32 protein [Sphingomonas sp. MAHUQ-71]|uniref:beta-fructofuranosidase n=1 Tax=Sphingomonas oryzagri TaxID=3042314 RepID=A0ABT6N1J7_9SPHN|nr:glycoside hydrolase family 32 protein [Sphingomonas oryzagri]MDH7639159.1 glycoside hydrolase family 32 protein [Sphingomonas oryzagri]